MKNFTQMMKMAQQAQARMGELQASLEQAEMTGAAGGGMVQVTLTGKGDVRRIKIDPALVVAEETEVLEDLILAAFKDAKARVDSFAAEEMSKLTGGMPMPPGFKLPF
jgi:nucleoid-associated protein EbfC